MTLPQLLVHLLRFDATIVLVLLLLLPILPVGLSLIAIQRLGALAFKSLGGVVYDGLMHEKDTGLADEDCRLCCRRVLLLFR